MAIPRYAKKQSKMIKVDAFEAMLKNDHHDELDLMIPVYNYWRHCSRKEKREFIDFLIRRYSAAAQLASYVRKNNWF